jgi:hypothetical protein
LLSRQMNDKVKQRCEHLLYVLKAPESIRKDLFCSKELVTTFCELVLNVLYGEIETSSEEKEVLKKSKHLCELIATDKKGLQEKIGKIRKLDSEVLNIFTQILERYV